MKKVMTILTFIFVMLCISKVEANSVGKKVNRTEEGLADLMETKVSKDEEIWEFINTAKYTADNMVMYKIGNKDESDSETYISELTDDPRIQRIIKNGYGEKEAAKYGLSSDADFYLATKMALDCLENDIKPEEINEFYRKDDSLCDELKTRIEDIIKAAKDILIIGINGNETYSRNAFASINGEIAKDNLKDDYYCQFYDMKITGIGCDKYTIEDTGESSINYVIANAKTSEEQKEFERDENQFKILIPAENGHDDFTIKFKITANFLGENFYIGTDSINKYIVFAKNEQEEETVYVELHNRNSNLSLNFIDEETEENIHGIEVEVDGQSNFVDSYQNIVKTNIPKSTVHVKIISVPEDYEIENLDYDIDIMYNENHVETIKLKHKKGKVEITTNAGDAEYEIYDSESNKIIPYVIQDDGNIYIAQINTGKYRLKQINVNNKYELAKDIEFTIKHNETTKITLQNELKENENKENTQKEVEDQKNNDKVEENKEQNKDADKNKDDIKDNKGDNKEIEKEPEENSKEPNNNNNDVQEEIESEKPKDENSDNNSNTENLKEEEKENLNYIDEKLNESNQDEDIEKLPRTGDDYFLIKLIFINLILFTFCIFILKKTDCKKNLNSLHLIKFKG